MSQSLEKPRPRLTMLKFLTQHVKAKNWKTSKIGDIPEIACTWKYQSHLEGSPWGRPQSAGPSLNRWGRWSVGNIFIPSILSCNLGSGIQRGSDCPTLLRDISVIQPVHTKAAPSPAEVATIHTQQVLSDKNTCNWIDSAGKPVESGTRVDSSKMVFC